MVTQLASWPKAPRELRHVPPRVWFPGAGVSSRKFDVRYDIFDGRVVM